jgi:hypothetical protein
MKRWLQALFVAALLAPSVARADHPFILPSSTILSGDGNTVTFDAAGSDHVFFFDHRPVQLDSIAIVKPDGTSAVPTQAIQGRLRSVFDLKLDQQGTWKIESDQTRITGTFKLAGEERRVGGRGGRPAGAGDDARENERGGDDHSAADRERAAGITGSQHEGSGSSAEGGPRRQPPVAFEDIPADATDVHLTETVSRTATFVTVGAPTTTVFKPTGRGLEFDPITHPNSLAVGETARFRFLIDGKPAAGLKVTVVRGGDRYRDDTGELDFTTDKDGVIAITWPAAGMYWMGAEAQDKNPSEKRAEVRKMNCAVTLEVMTP